MQSKPPFKKRLGDLLIRLMERYGECERGKAILWQTISVNPRPGILQPSIGEESLSRIPTKSEPMDLMEVGLINHE